MTRPIVRIAWIALLMAPLPVGPAALASENGREIEADFSAGSYDRWLFRAHSAMRGPAFGRWEQSDKGLRGIMPPGDSQRAPLRFVALVELEGDFTITTSFEIAKLPLPRLAAATNRIELAIRGRDGFASVYRHASKDIEGFGYEWGRNYNVRYAPKITKGQLQLVRHGAELTFLCSDGGAPPEAIGTASFGTGPVEEVALLVNPRESRDGIDVRFDRLHIEAGGIRRQLSPPGSGIPSWVWFLGVVLILTPLLYRRYKRMRDEE